MKQVNQAAMWIAKISEILHWGMAVLAAVLFVGCFAAKDWVAGLLEADGANAVMDSMEVYGFSFAVADGVWGTAHVAAIALVSLAILTLMAMVFRNIYLIFRLAQKETPFHKDNIRMVREIGIFCIALPMVELAASVAVSLIFGVDGAEISVQMDGVFMGLVVLCLSQFFAYGAQLQQDVDGLI